MLVLETERLRLRRIVPEDAGFILKLLNEPSFLQYIGDKGVRNLDDARRYIESGPTASYQRFGFGLDLVEHKRDAAPMGICGLLKRDTLPDVDVGFAFVPAFWSQGYAFEAASAVVRHGRQALGLRRILAITSPDNEASIKLLGKLGFRFERMMRLTEAGEEIRLFVSDGGAFRAGSVELSGGFSVPGAVDEVFELFSPLGERLWVPDWSPELLHPLGATWERGLLFRTREERGDAIWVVTRLDRGAHEVDYQRVEPDRYVARITVKCSAAGAERTAVETRYGFVGLSEAGNAEIAAMTPEDYGRKMARWEAWISQRTTSRG